MHSQRVIIMGLLVALLGMGCNWWAFNWQWWTVIVPFIIVMSIAEAIEQEIRGWH